VDRAAFLSRSRENARATSHPSRLGSFEAGKPWREADGDVCEAIDYSTIMGKRWCGSRRHVSWASTLANSNTYLYQPRGIAVVIAPWNFPLAIFDRHDRRRARGGQYRHHETGGTDSRHRSPAHEIFRSVGLPPGVLSYLPGLGEEIGEYLVRHPRTNVIAFTGSLAVGCISTRPQQSWAKARRHQENYC